MTAEAFGRQFAGKVEEDILRIIQEEYNINLPDDFNQSLRQAINHRLDNELQPIAGMQEVVAAVSVPRAVVSNSRLVRVTASLKVAGLSDLFGENVFAVDLVDNPKPAPDLYLLAAQRLGVEPAACLVVEDSASGVTAAHRAGMAVIGLLAASHITEGHGDALRAAGAYATATSANDLMDHLRTAGVTQ
jgi:HAD superfamily hydrolase (TIGR01509 family)